MLSSSSTAPHLNLWPLFSFIVPAPQNAALGLYKKKFACTRFVCELTSDCSALKEDYYTRRPIKTISCSYTPYISGLQFTKFILFYCYSTCTTGSTFRLPTGEDLFSNQIPFNVAVRISREGVELYVFFGSFQAQQTEIYELLEYTSS